MECLLKKTYRLLFFGLLVFLFKGSKSFSQVTDPLTSRINIPTSPEAALFTRFGDIPVGYYTGTADISIPLYVVKEGMIEIPITLRYHSSGIKVEDNATWVGLGWDLSPEGSIVQEIRGLADQFDVSLLDCGSYIQEFYQRFTLMQDNSFWFLPQWGRVMAPNMCLVSRISAPPPPYPWNSSSYEDPYCLVNGLTIGRGEPDIYNYSFSGNSGKFYIHPGTQEIVVIEKNSEVKFSKVNYNEFTAVTTDGTVYTFGDIETIDAGILLEYTGKTYKLSSIVQLSGKRIDFSYENARYTAYHFSETADVNHFAPGPAVTSHSSYTNNYNKVVKSITGTDVIVNFNLGSRDDINIGLTDNVQKLNSIDIVSRETGKKIKTYQFSYSYFPYNMLGAQLNSFVNNHLDAFGKRLKLDGIQELGYDSNENIVNDVPPYNFEYDMSITMPLKISFAKDFWGYYNGKPNTRLLPNLDYFDYFYKETFAVINQTLSYPYIGANRFTDNSFAGANMLKRITYPTGGFSEFEYEPNSFDNQFIPDASHNIFKSWDAIDNSIGGNGSISFKLSKSTTLHFENRINNGKGNYNNIPPLSYQQMEDCSIILRKMKVLPGLSPQFETIKQWDLSTVLNVDFIANGGKLWNDKVRIPYDDEGDVTYIVQAYFPDNLNNPLFASIAGVTSHITYYDDTGVDISKSNQCGMRVRTIKSYTEEGELASHKALRYKEGKLLHEFRPLTIYKANHLNQTEVIEGIGMEYIAYYKKITASGTNFGATGGNLIGYGHVEEVQVDKSNTTNGKKSFKYLNQVNRTSQDCPANIYKTNGQLYKEEIYDNLDKKVFEKSYNYTAQASLFPPKFIALRIVKLATGSKVSCDNIHSAYPILPWQSYFYDASVEGIYVASQYGYNAYTIDAEWWRLTQTTTKLFDGNTVQSTVENYTYNDQGSIQSSSVVDSKGETLITNYFYPQDYTGTSAYDLMTAVNHIGTPVVTENYIKDKNDNLKLLTKSRTTYASFPDVLTVMPQNVYMQKGNSPEQLSMTINSYDNKGNITQYTQNNNIPTAIVWNSSKSYPIAKVENATYSSLLALPNGLNADFRTSLPNARVTSYTYKPLIGVATITDANNKNMFYEYDSYGRLLFIKDHEDNIIKTFHYQYR